MQTSLLGAVLSFSFVVACSGEAAHAPAPVTPVQPPSAEAPESESPAPPPPAGKRPPCKGDQSCNEDPSVSALWGKCTEYGVCECNQGFTLNPKGRCEPK